jgi:hypothetical protein
MPITGFVDTSRPHSAKDHIILGEIKRFRKAALTGGRPFERATKDNKCSVSSPKFGANDQKFDALMKAEFKNRINKGSH